MKHSLTVALADSRYIDQKEFLVFRLDNQHFFQQFHHGDARF